MREMNLPEHWKTMPLVELYELPRGWVWKTLQEVCLAPQYGWTTKASPHGTVQLLRTTDITTGLLNWDTVPFCSEEPPDKEKYLLKTGDIVISRAGSVGYSHLVKNPPDAVFASYLIRFRPLPMVDADYLSFFLQSSFYWNAISTTKMGSTLPGVNATKLKRVPVPLPPLPEQRAIAHVLQTIQEAKITRQREIALAREHKAALIDYLFSHGTKGEPRKQTEIGEIPERWKTMPLVELYELPRGWVWKTLQEVCLAPQYGWTTKASPHGTVHLLRTTDITTGLLKWDTVPFCSEEPPDKEKYLLKTGDIVISRAGSVGYSHLVKNPPDAVFASYLIRFRPLPMIDADYLSFFLQSSFYWNTISTTKMGSTLPGVNATKLKRIPVPLPPLPEQRTIAQVFQAIEEKIAALEQEVIYLDELFYAMLEELMTGQRTALPLLENGVIQ